MADKIADATPLRPTLMKQFETDEDLDQYVIDHAYMFTVIRPTPGGFVSGLGSNYQRTEIHVKDYDGLPEKALEAALEKAAELYKEHKRTLLIYAVADFSGAIGFNRPVRQYPASTYRSKADRARDEKRARQAARKEKKDPKKS